MTRTSTRTGIAGVAALLGLLGALAVGSSVEEPLDLPFEDGRSAFAVRFGNEVCRYRVLAATAMPGDTLSLAIDHDGGSGTYTLSADGGEVIRAGPRSWDWRAPEAAGLHPLSVVRDGDGESLALNVFVLVPLDRIRNGRLNGYRIGEYPLEPYKGLEIYTPPEGFVELTAATLMTPVSPHFTLGQFACKQESEFPKYLVLRTRLLRKLEYVLQKINAAGIRCDGLEVMSGYRTPWYNKAIGNVKYSRHVWGGAADVFIDVSPRDGQMDDLNGDGRSDVMDAARLYALIDGQYGGRDWSPFVGGLGQYRRTANHGPFVHVDVRGFRARWGD